MTEHDEAAAWLAWAEKRDASVSAPYGPLALTATHWLTEETTLDGVPGLWSPAPGDLVELKATASDGLLLADEPVDGRVLLRPDTHADPSVVLTGDLRLLPILREGDLAVRVYDPASPARASFDRIDRFDHDATWAVPAVYTPYAEARTEQVLNADGRHRGLGLSGEIVFDLDGERRTLAVSGSEDATLSLVFGDATNDVSTFAFRFLTLPAPDVDGATILDFNRAHLPPCSFSDHFICPVPPAGNRLAVAVEAGEKARLTVGES